MSEYDDFYAKGGWKYFGWLEKRFLLRRIVRPLGLAQGSRVLEIGCGMGLHSYLLHKLGFDVVGVDLSETGIARAKTRFSGPMYYAMDAKDLTAEFDDESFHTIFVRGMSWYHYELLEVNKNGVDVPAATRELFQLLKPSGVFVLQIKTDFSGSRTRDNVYHNYFDDYVQLFSPLGDVIHVSDWRGKVLRNHLDAERSKKSIIIATRK